MALRCHNLREGAALELMVHRARLRLNKVACSRLRAPITPSDVYCPLDVCLELYGVVSLIFSSYVSNHGCVKVLWRVCVFVSTCMMVDALSIKWGDSLFWCFIDGWNNERSAGLFG